MKTAKLLMLAAIMAIPFATQAKKKQAPQPAAAVASIIPGQLRVEHMADPLAVDTKAPRLMWINAPATPQTKGAAQSAYRIVVASSAEKLANGDYDLWDTGRTPSAQSYLVEYEGAPLTDGIDCYWQVQVWDESGTPSPWSPVGRWGMGLMSPDSWKAQWIGAPWQGEKSKKDIDEKKQRRDYPAPLLRKRFTLKDKPVKAKAFVTAMGYFEFDVNGRKVSDDLLVPNFTNYTPRYDLEKRYSISIDPEFSGYRTLYLAYDVTDMLDSGANAIGVVLGNGFADSTTGWVSPFGSPRMICQLEVEYPDGTTDTIVSDDTWQAAPSAIEVNGPFDGEVYNAAAERPDWCTVADTSAGWLPAAIRKAPEGRLVAHTAPTDKVVETFSPSAMTVNPDGSVLIEFPVEISGWIRVKDLPMKAGETLNIKYHCDQPLGVHKYKAAADGPVNYAPRFTWYVFSKATVKGLSGEIKPENFVAEAVNTDVPVNSRFESNLPLIDSIITIWQRSQQDNLHGGIASDCPHRERAPYTGDGQVSMGAVVGFYDAPAFYRKWMADMRDAQNPTTGYVPNGAPWQPGCGGGVAWGAAMNVMPWEYYLRYGDTRVLAENYPAMKAQVEYMQQWLTPEGTMNARRPCSADPNKAPYYWLNLGDWCAPYELPANELVHTFYLWRCLDYTARAARALGFADDHQFYNRRAEEVADAFHNKFYNDSLKTYGDFGANVFALEIGVPADRHEDVVEALRHEIADLHDGHLNTGIFASRYLFEQLGKHGLNDLALGALLKRDYPSFGYWLAQGATTTWEKWNGQDSHNHPMFGGGLTWLFNTLAGVQTNEAAPGFSHFTVAPQPANGLEFARYTTETPYGTLVSDFHTNPDGSYTLNLTVPVGATAHVVMPMAPGSTEAPTPITATQGTHTFHSR